MIGTDTVLTAESIASANMEEAELVVLSACEAGLGDVFQGEGVLSLREAFHQAGARSVIASLWKVDDRETLTLMILFYDRLWNEGVPPAEALRKAQLSLYRRPDLIQLAENPPRLLEEGRALADQHDKAVAQSRIGDWAAFSISLMSLTGLNVP